MAIMNATPATQMLQMGFLCVQILIIHSSLTSSLVCKLLLARPFHYGFDQFSREALRDLRIVAVHLSISSCLLTQRQQ